MRFATPLQRPACRPHCDIKTLSELLGHADAAVTLKKYVHSDMIRKRREINRIFENF